jgi:hypothetical protein
MEQLAKSFAELAEKYGPSVADAARGAAVTEAYSCLVGSLIWFLLAIVALSIGRFLWRVGNDKDHDDDGMAFFFSIVAFIAAGILFMPGLWTWIDPWTWTTINHPELWIAKQAFHL